MVIKYFSWIKEHIGKSEEQLELPKHINNVNELINEEHDCCETKIQSEILQKNIIDVNNRETITNILNS